MRWLGLWCCLTLGAWAQEPNIPRLWYQDFPDHSEIWLENHLDVDSTVTFHVKELTNLDPSQLQDLTMTVSPHTKKMLFRLVPRQPDQAWRYDYEYHFTWGSLEARHDPAATYALPFAAGRSYRLTQGFNTNFTHKGELAYAVDFDLPEGSPVHCAREGEVVYIEDRFREGGLRQELWNRVNVILVRHSDGTIGEYAHLQPGGARVQVGQKVGAGDLLGYSGHVGYASCPHLHFVIYKASSGYERQSFPMKFRTRNGLETPVEGHTYRRDS